MRGSAKSQYECGGKSYNNKHVNQITILAQSSFSYADKLDMECGVNLSPVGSGGDRKSKREIIGFVTKSYLILQHAFLG